MKKTSLSLIILATFGTLTSCSQPSEDRSELNVVAGRVVTPQDPITRHVVALLNSDGQFFCTGSLVGKRVVMTAAHCVDGVKSSLYVVFGLRANNARAIPRENIRKAVGIVMNREYIDTVEYLGENHEGPINQQDLAKRGKFVSDIGYIKLDQDAPNGYLPLKIMPAEWKLKVGHPIHLVGYGITATLKEGVKPASTEDFLKRENLEDDSGILRSISTYYLGRNELGEFVVGHPNKRGGVCSGDSGGPAIVALPSKTPGQINYYQLGVAARSNCYNRGSYTDVRAHRGWIQKVNNMVHSQIK